MYVNADNEIRTQPFRFSFTRDLRHQLHVKSTSDQNLTKTGPFTSFSGPCLKGEVM